MAVAYDNSNTGAANTATWTHTIGGANYTLFVMIQTFNGAVSAVTYNSVSMTQLASTSNSSGILYVYGLQNPATGGNTVSITTTSTKYRGVSASYSGTNQDASHLYDAIISQGQSTASNNVLSITPIASNCWAIMLTCVYGSTSVGGANATISGGDNRAGGSQDGTQFVGEFDSNGTISVASHQYTVVPTSDSGTVTGSIFTLLTLDPAGTTYNVTVTSPLATENIQGLVPTTSQTTPASNIGNINIQGFSPVITGQDIWGKRSVPTTSFTKRTVPSTTWTKRSP